MTQKLPRAYLDRMRRLLGEAEFERYLASFSEKRSAAFRCNRLKCRPDELKDLLAPGIFADPVSWTDNGFYYGKEELSRHPAYYAGLYYLQEPSAMTPAACLPLHPGDRVLDLCAAPGGKSTELGARLGGTGVLIANDISHSRALALLGNLERFGIPNLFVTSEASGKLADSFPEWFDAILIDAPCSGEGMFRKDPHMVEDWLEKGPSYYAPIQKQLLSDAARMLAPGGYLLYSTCTFAPEEDEEQILAFLSGNPDFSPIRLDPDPAFCHPQVLCEAVKAYPHRLRGEGHFICLLQKAGGEAADSAVKEGRKPEKETLPPTFRPFAERFLSLSAASDRGGRFRDRQKAAACRDRSAGRSSGKPLSGKASASQMAQAGLSVDVSAVTDFFAAYGLTLSREALYERDGELYLLPDGCLSMPSLRYLRTGLHLGTRKNGRILPSQALAMTLSPETWNSCLKLPVGDERILRYLKGETLQLGEEDGEVAGDWVLVCMDRFPLGFAKKEKRLLKNKYQTGWRYRS